MQEPLDITYYISPLCPYSLDLVLGINLEVEQPSSRQVLALDTG